MNETPDSVITEPFIFTVADALRIYRIGFNHGKSCAPYQGDDIVEVFRRAAELANNLKFD